MSVNEHTTETKNISISYIVESGKNAGSICEPHKQKNGYYIVSKTRFKADYVYVGSYKEILKYLDMGYRVRVSDKITRKTPSLVKKESLIITT